MTMRHILAAAASALAIAGICACGGSDEPKTEADRVKQVSVRFNDAYSSGDYGTACDLLHSRRKKDLEFEQDQSCEDILAHAGDIDSTLVKALGSAKTTNVTITGNTATVDLEGGALGPGRQAILERDGDSWRVTEPAAGL